MSANIYSIPRARFVSNKTIKAMREIISKRIALESSRLEERREFIKRVEMFAPNCEHIRSAIVDCNLAIENHLEMIAFHSKHISLDSDKEIRIYEKDYTRLLNLQSEKYYDSVEAVV